jgi:dolichol-phosphate mannosyltransferase
MIILGEAMLKNLSVLVPVHNEEENISPLILEINSALKGKVHFEILVINDASTDSSANILQNLQKNHPYLRVIRHLQRRGQSAAILIGVKVARYEWIATLDGDGQNNPLDILKLIEAARNSGALNDASLLCMGYRKNRQDTWSRKISSNIANSIRRAILKDQNPDSACGIKLFPRQLFLEIPHFRNDHRFLPALFKRAGATIICVPVHHRPRLHGTSKYGLINRLGTGIMDLLGVAWLMRRKIDTESVEHESQ